MRLSTSLAIETPRGHYESYRGPSVKDTSDKSTWTDPEHSTVTLPASQIHIVLDKMKKAASEKQTLTDQLNEMQRRFNYIDHLLVIII